LLSIFVVTFTLIYSESDITDEYASISVLHCDTWIGSVCLRVFQLTTLLLLT